MTAEQTSEQGAVFNVEKIYVRDVSYEAPNVPKVFLEQKVPEVGIQLNISHSLVDKEQNIYEVLLAITVTAKIADKNVFLAEAHQGGLFRITGVPEGDLPMVLEIGCPNILLPFAREVINDLVVKGGFPQLLINPVNFEALYQQKLAAANKPASH